MAGYAGWRDWIPPTSQTPVVGKRRSKFNAERTTVDGHVFDSKREADRYSDLVLQQRAGEIGDLELQPQFPISVMTPGGVLVRVANYRADFKYTRNGTTVIEDVKSSATRTEAYKLRKALVEAQHGVRIVEV